MRENEDPTGELPPITTDTQDEPTEDPNMPPLGPPTGTETTK